MSGTNEVYLVWCLNCKKEIQAKDAAYLIGERDSHFGMCEDCVSADTKSEADDDDDE